MSNNFISPEKAAEIEFKYVESEIRYRQDFERKSTHVQILLFSAIFTYLGRTVSEGLANTHFLIQFLSVTSIAINIAFINEASQNAKYIIRAAYYAHKVLREKYTISGGEKIYDWEVFLKQIDKNHFNFLSCIPFTTSVDIYICWMVVAIASIILLYSIAKLGLSELYIIVPYSFFTYLATIIALSRFYSSAKLFKTMITTSDEECFIQKYGEL